MFVDEDGEFFVPIVIGALIGGYAVGAIANDHGNPLKWDYKSGKTWKGIGLGAVSGAFAGSGIAFGGSYVEGHVYSPPNRLRLIYIPQGRLTNIPHLFIF
jgi:hypothetical protein